MRKQLDKISVIDLNSNPVWYFIGESEDTDELTIEPATEKEIKKDYAIIVKCMYQTSKGKEYSGYIHWQEPFSIDALQPVILLNQNTNLYFWQGMFPPEDIYTKNISEIIRKDDFPIKYSSVSIFGLKEISGVLEGLYYFSKDKTVIKKQIG